MQQERNCICSLIQGKTLEGLAIRGLDASKLLGNCPVDVEALSEIDRLRSTLPVVDLATLQMNDREEDDEMLPEDEEGNLCSIT